MIGNEQFTVTRLNKYLLSSAAGVDKVPTAQPPTAGCYVRVEAVGTSGSIVIIGTVGGSSTTETISSYDSELVGFGTKLFTAISKVTISGFTSAILYPANESGEKINLTSYTTFTIMADCYTQYNSESTGKFIEFGGIRSKLYRSLMFDGRYSLLNDDLITIDNEQFKVVDVSSQHGLYFAILATTRTV